MTEGNPAEKLLTSVIVNAKKKDPSSLDASSEGASINPMLSVCPTKTLSFDEIIPGNGVRVTSDNMIYAVDLTMVITGKHRNESGCF